MAGVPIGMCKRAMREAIAKLRPVDTFNIVTFAGATARAFPSARPANHANIERALGFLGRAQAGGGTHMENAVREVLRPNVAGGRHRYVFFLTDGYVGHENEIISGSRQLVAAISPEKDAIVQLTLASEATASEAHQKFFSQEGLQRAQVKAMLDEWERRTPGRRSVMFRALRNVRPSHLVDSGLFDFAALVTRGEPARD